MLDKAGIDSARAPAAGGGVDRWIPVMILSNGQNADSSYLAKSIVANVDDVKKKQCYLQMVDALFRAVTLDDFSQYFNNSIIRFKVAHSFRYKGRSLSLHELKKPKKDRIYLYLYNGSHGKYVFVLVAVHKDQQNTPDDVKQYAEKAIKDIEGAVVMGPVN